MIVAPLSPGFYSLSNQLLISMLYRDAERLRARWQDEASEAALNGNPRRADFVEYMAARI